MAEAKYYKLSWSDSDDAAVVHLMDKQGRVGMHSFDFSKDKLIFEILHEGMYEDYLASSESIWLCSEKLRNVLEENKAKSDGIDWYSVEINASDTSGLSKYYVFCPSERDVLDYEKSQVTEKSVPSSPVKIISATWPQVDPIKAAGSKIFVAKYSPTFPIIHESVVHAIKRSKCTGVSFSRCINPFYRRTN